MTRPGILVVSASTGTGHGRAADALAVAMRERDPSLRVEHVDILDLAPRIVKLAYGRGFELVAARAPWLWRELYHRTDGPADDPARWGGVTEQTLFREFRRYVCAGDWRLCLCTHFLPAQLAAGRPGLPPFGLVLTDFTLHRYWVQRGVERYYVATRALAGEVRSRASGVRVEATGIPVDPGVLSAPPGAEARASLGVPADAPVALAIGGGLGISIEATVRRLLADSPEVTVVAVCGRNESARARLAALERDGAPLRVFGYVDDIERFIAAADVVVTKPGGLTTSEALALGRPLVLTRAIPGHEEGNARTLVDAGAALYAPDADDVGVAVARLFSQPDLLAGLASAARRLGRPHAARQIARDVERTDLLASVA